MKTKVIIERLKQKWFPSVDDKVWREWVDYKSRGTNDLVWLLKSDVRDSLKRRAIFLLLVPSEEFNQIYWTEKVGKFNHKLDFLEILNPDLLSYATDLIVDFYTTLRPMHCERPKHYTQGGGGFTIFMSVPDKYNDALYFYNNCIMLLLTILPDEQCEQIFPLFSLRDLSTYSGMEDASGYNPFHNLLYSKVDEKWKKQADATMRQIIMDELSGKTKPREEWENALQCYAYIIKLQLYGEKLPYSVDMFANQIKFLVSLENCEKEIIDGHKVSKIFQILSDDAHKAIRYDVAKFVIFDNKREFCVWDDESLQSANMMLDEFSQDEEKLAEKIIQSAIESYNKKLVESKNKKKNDKNAEDEIINKMK